MGSDLLDTILIDSDERLSFPQNVIVTSQISFSHSRRR